jgi:hypothetical protein
MKKHILHICIILFAAAAGNTQQSDFLKPDHIALAHVNVKEENVAESKIGPVRRKYKDIFVLLPGMPVKTFRK